MKIDKRIDSNVEILEKTAELKKPTIKSKIFSFVQVFIVFCIMHVSMRFLKQYTALGGMEKQFGLNFSPGVLMLLISFVALRIKKISFKEAGLNLDIWPKSPNLPTRLHKIYGTILLCTLWVWVIIKGFNSTQGPWLTILIASCRFFAVGFGEEIFFRGYIQTTFNKQFSLKFEYLGAKFGWGLILSSFFFGLIHGLNTVDYFNGIWNISWSWGIGTFCVGLFYGYIRERSGGCFLGILIHASRGLLSTFIPVPGHI